MYSLVGPINTYSIKISIWAVFRDIKLRSYSSGGGLAVLDKEDIASSRWKGLEETAEDKKVGKERIWILMITGMLRLAILNIAVKY